MFGQLCPALCMPLSAVFFSFSSSRLIFLLDPSIPSMAIPTAPPKNIWVAAGDGDMARVQELVDQHCRCPQLVK
ncbi:hypothetical protein BDZ94DRAFT_1247258 [Collybia nuda]|uniref:Secreted protein n=1 Tax=Collybia nuda TaxID=64659 RepID=A0A9P6CPL9_9AGAR|nr:hypothetical protein BDZ94DRAFT_1247258 [Collybia nuda]